MIFRKCTRLVLLSKVRVLILGKVRNIKVVSDICTGTGSAFFWGPNSGTFGESGHIEGPKNDTFQCWYKKIQDHFYNWNFPQQWGLWHLISFFVTWECVFFDDLHFWVLLGPFLEGKSDQNWNAKKKTKEKGLK